MNKSRISVAAVCLDWRRHPDESEAVQLCRSCLREMIGRLDDLERRLEDLEPDQIQPDRVR